MMKSEMIYNLTSLILFTIYSSSFIIHPPMPSLLNNCPDPDLPREKIYKYGSAALSNAELMALFLSSGTVGRNVIEVANDLLMKYGSLQEMGRMPVSEYMNNKGIGLAKACKLAAAFELGIRLSKERLGSVPLDSPQLIYDHFSVLRKTLWKMADLDRKVHRRYVCRWTSPQTTMLNCSAFNPHGKLRVLISMLGSFEWTST